MPYIVVNFRFLGTWQARFFLPGDLKFAERLSVSFGDVAGLSHKHRRGCDGAYALKALESP
jgi:hypothetical protein